MNPLNEDCQTVFQRSVLVPKTPYSVFLFFIGDNHLGSELFSESAWKHAKNEIKAIAKHHDCYYAGMADYTEGLGRTDRDKIQALRESTRERIAKKDLIPQDKRVIDELEFTKGKWLFMLDGNHKWVYPTGQSNAEIIAKNLSAMYAGGATFGAIQFIFNGKAKITKKIYARHQLPGGGFTAGAGLNAVERMSRIARADIYALGHIHRLSSDDLPILDLQHNVHSKKYELKQTQQIFITTGSTLRGYRANTPSYVVRSGYRPAALGFNYIEFKFNQHEYHTEGGRVNHLVCRMTRHSL